jgi:glycosyltransferase involved in cell wall biosynthesis
LLKSLNYLETPIQLAIIGPLSWDSAYNEKLMMLIDKVNKKSIHKVIYLGAQEPKEIVKWYQKASVFVLPSLSESFGIVNLEALSCETPVVASNTGGIPEIVHNHKNGILVPPCSSVELARGIQYLLDNQEVRKKFGKEGRRWVVENFSSEITVKKLLQIYKEMIH